MSTEPLVYSVAELQRELKCGRHTALRLANEIGVRISARRLVVPRTRLLAYLGGDAMANGTGDENRRRPGGVQDSV